MTETGNRANTTQWESEEWYIERSELNPGFGIALTKDRVLFHERSEFQEVEIFENRLFGNVMLIDNLVMVTEKDEFVYHEMIVHVPMCVNPDATAALVIGGGDGGTVRELVKYPAMERIDMVEIDRMVCDVARQYLPTLSRALDHEKVNLVYEDGIQFVKNTPDSIYDLVIVDSTDPVGPGEVLFTEEFYRDCIRILKDDGIMTNQSETPFVGEDMVRGVCRKVREVFPFFRPYYGVIPTYPGALWLFGFASKGVDPLHDMRTEAWNRLGLATRYYNTALHTACFALPTFIQKLCE